MDGPWGYHAKWYKSDGQRQILYDFTHMWNIKNKQKTKINEQTKQKQTCTHEEQSSGYQLGKGRGEGEMGKKGSTLW